jgi:hypothetical protein
MHLYYDLDDDPEILDEDSLTGYLSLCSGGSQIEEHDVFLDSWLAALVEGLAAVEAGEEAAVEIEEEVYPLVFEPAEDGFRLSYGGDGVTIPSTREFRELLKATCRFFLLEAQSRIGSGTNASLLSLQAFVGPEPQAGELRPPRL